jgi:3alpha(or 20beta)-hydroxysteroid dehydrogenase
MTEDRLAGRVAIITGGAKGQGAAEVGRFLAEGARVVVADVLEEQGRALVAEVGAGAVFHRLDVTSPTDWDGAIAAAQELGPLRALVNNAGVHRVEALEDETLEGFLGVLQVNLVGAFLGMQRVVDPMRRNGGGAIVNVSSIAGMTAYPGHSAYGSSKWALRGLSRVAAMELGVHGIRVNSIYPGPIATDMLGRDDRPGRFDHLPLGRAGEPDEVAALVAFLCSDDSAYMTGAEMTVDGGSTAGTPRSRG